MEISRSLLEKVESDLGFNRPFVKGQESMVSNCWHFYTDGACVDTMFYSEDDFRDGMNRICVVSTRFRIVILAFVLMDTHVHFVLAGEYDECNRFVHEYVRLTSRYISFSHNDRKKLRSLSVSCQQVKTDLYLKTVICYVIKNPSTAGLPYLANNYPWSSGPLYFAGSGSWSAPLWTEAVISCSRISESGISDIRFKFHTRERIQADARIMDGIIFPGDYVAYQLVERLYRSAKSFQYFMSLNRDSEIESRDIRISNLSISIQEMRQRKNELCLEMFGKESMKSLNTTDRVLLARSLRLRFNCSKKQILRICGLKYEEAQNLI